jgi:hypothetical protein
MTDVFGVQCRNPTFSGFARQAGSPRIAKRCAGSEEPGAGAEAARAAADTVNVPRWLSTS